jgi:hypothetical protein
MNAVVQLDADEEAGGFGKVEVDPLTCVRLKVDSAKTLTL